MTPKEAITNPSLTSESPYFNGLRTKQDIEEFLKDKSILYSIRTEELIHLSTKAYTLAIEVRDALLQLKVGFILAWAYNQAFQAEGVLSTVKQLKPLLLIVPSSSLDIAELKANILFQEARALEWEDDWESSIQVVNQALKFLENYHPTPIRFRLVQQIAINLQRAGNIAGAVRYYLEASKLVEPRSFYANELYYNLAYLSYKAGDLVAAREYFNESCMCDIGSNPGTRHYQSNLSVTLLESEDRLEEALGEADQEVSDAKDFGANHHIALALNLRGVIYNRLNRFEEAIKDFEEALPLSPANFLNLHILTNLAVAHASKASKAALDGHSATAFQCLSQAEQLLEEITDFEKPSCIEEMTRSYELLGDLPKAYKFIKLSNSLKASLYSSQVRNQIASSRTIAKLEEEQHERKIEHMKREQTEKELSNSTLQLIAQTELLEELRGSLTSIIRKLPAGNEVAKELREKLRNLPCKSVDWERFDTQFKAAHPEFTQKLTTQYSELSPTEIRICSLVRMNLKSEEIARLFCLSARTIENHRYNIRKKMDLAEGADLMKELMKL